MRNEMARRRLAALTVIVAMVVAVQAHQRVAGGPN